ncbi:MAG: pyruvate:ferredoxin (flavodoxin) oxidoreductase [Acidimicrobiales bacterium]|nr:pyruvate:ferredoxin (flavodoxin) oxidoreductase [Acidimicrobiales bacterium]
MSTEESTSPPASSPAAGSAEPAAAASRRAGHEIMDGNEAAARVAHLASEVIAIYPITPASAMGEFADDWSARGHQNLWGVVPEVIEMQSEAGAAGTLHGAAMRGALATTFTASQGLLLMLPNMFKIAGELTPAVLHVAARAVATHALSIFGDHSDVMAARTTGWAMLCASSVQEAGDFAAVAHSATLQSRVPFLHFFDGFRTSHELNTVTPVAADQLRLMIDEGAVRAHRDRGLDSDRPMIRGTAQNPDVFFQAREACNPFYEAVPGATQAAFDQLAALTGREYHLVDYHGAPDADRVVVLMGSAAGAVTEAVDALNATGARVGVAVVRLFRPFPTAQLLAALPPSVRTIAVLDRTKEPGAPFEPLHQDVLAALWHSDAAHWADGVRPRLIGGRYGLSSKEFTPAMAKAVFDEAATDDPLNGFTVGIIDDVTRLSLDVDPSFTTDTSKVRAVFYGLGSDGTVGANKNTAKIVGSHTDLHVQGYFVYDSKKSGSMTVSHLRFDDRPIESTYLIDQATFVGVHQWNFLQRMDVLKLAAEGAVVLINSPHRPEDVWAALPEEAQQQVLDRHLRLYTIDAAAVAKAAGLGGRVNTVMQTCFFALAGVLPTEQAIAALKDAIEHTYGKRGSVIVERNVAAVDTTLANLHEVPVGAAADSGVHRRAVVPPGSSDFVQRVTARMLAGEGDLLPVSALPPDGMFPTGTAKVERRTIAPEIPIWEPDLCIDCGKCAIVCPHAAIRLKVYEADALPSGATLKTKSFRSREVPGLSLTVQVAPDDCTGCGLCVVACPAHDKSAVKRKSINLQPIGEHLDTERAAWDEFLAVQGADATRFDPASVKTSQLRTPLFEFSGACSGCGETPYLKLLTQLFGDRLLIANATGCSSIYGGNLPTTPYTTDADGRGPAWANSLFEDNAEFGLGIRLGYEAQRRAALEAMTALADRLDPALTTAIADGVDLVDDAGIRAQRDRVGQLVAALAAIDAPEAARLAEIADALVGRSVWIVGGDGWAYDIGAGGLDHVLGSGRNVNVLVMDTEVYSNTGGQASKATPRGAVAKFAASGKGIAKKDLGLEAMSFGDVYVAKIALGASDVQTVKALLEAAAWPGVSLVIAYSSCVAHGYDMSRSMLQQKAAVQSGHWPLYRYRPGDGESTKPFELDSAEPSLPYGEFARSEARFGMLARSDPARAAELLRLAEADVAGRWSYYQQLAGIERSAPEHAAEATLAEQEDEA